jgi:hypothetical protein
MTKPRLAPDDADALADVIAWIVEHPGTGLSMDGRPGEWVASIVPFDPPPCAYATLAEALRAALKEARGR